MLSGTANPRIPAFIEGRCYACDRTFAYPASLIQHMSTIHQVNLSARKRGSHHPDISPRDYFVKKAEDDIKLEDPEEDGGVDEDAVMADEQGGAAEVMLLRKIS